MLVVFSTSGKSKNCIKAVKLAKKTGIEVIEWRRVGKTTEEIQNNQLKDIHSLYCKFK
jgi:phosphoheptose isomerase